MCLQGSFLTWDFFQRWEGLNCKSSTELTAFKNFQQMPVELWYSETRGKFHSDLSLLRIWNGHFLCPIHLFILSGRTKDSFCLCFALNSVTQPFLWLITTRWGVSGTLKSQTSQRCLTVKQSARAGQLQKQSLLTLLGLNEKGECVHVRTCLFVHMQTLVHNLLTTMGGGSYFDGGV